MKFSSETLADSKNRRTFASLMKTSTLENEVWRDGRVVDCGGLENRCTARYRGFESLSLRNKGCKSSSYEIYTLFYTQNKDECSFVLENVVTLLILQSHLENFSLDQVTQNL